MFVFTHWRIAESVSSSLCPWIRTAVQLEVAGSTKERRSVPSQEPGISTSRTFPLAHLLQVCKLHCAAARRSFPWCLSKVPHPLGLKLWDLDVAFILDLLIEVVLLIPCVRSSE